MPILSRAVENHLTDHASLLIQNGASLGTSDQTGTTPLGVAILMGWKDLVGILIGAGADLDQEDQFGATPRLMAGDGWRGEDFKRFFSRSRCAEKSLVQVEALSGMRRNEITKAIADASRCIEQHASNVYDSNHANPAVEPGWRLDTSWPHHIAEDLACEIDCDADRREHSIGFRLAKDGTSQGALPNHQSNRECLFYSSCAGIVVERVAGFSGGSSSDGSAHRSHGQGPVEFFKLRTGYHGAEATRFCAF